MCTIIWMRESRTDELQKCISKLKNVQLEHNRTFSSIAVFDYACTYVSDESIETGRGKLPEHTFYVDNIFAYQPLPYVKKIYYMDIDLYQYFLGRADQSVNEEVMMRRIDQQIKVTKIVASCVDLDEVRQKYPKLAVYMCRNIPIMMQFPPSISF